MDRKQQKGGAKPGPSNTAHANKKRREEDDEDELEEEHARSRKQQHDEDDSGSEDDDSGTEEDDTDASDADSDSDDGDDASEINVTFEFMDPQPIDFKSMRRLLEHFLPGSEDTFPISDMVDAVLGQAEVGTTVKVEDDVDVYAFSTLIPLAKHADEAWLKHTRRYLLAKAQPQQTMHKLQKLLGGSKPKASETDEAGVGAGSSKAKDDSSSDDSDSSDEEERADAGASSSAKPAPAKTITPPAPGVALLLNERVVNMPPELAPSILANLHDDVEWARTKGPKEDRETYAQLTHLVIVAPCWIERAAKPKPAAEDPDAPPAPPRTVTNTVHYYHWEDAHFEREATMSFEFPVAAKQETGAATGSSSSGAGSKRKAASDDAGGEEGAAAASVRAPQIRRVFVVPYAALKRVADSTKRALELAREEDERAKKVAVARLTGHAGAGSSSAHAGPSRGAAGKPGGLKKGFGASGKR